MLRFQRSLSVRAAGMAVACLALLAGMPSPAAAQTTLTHNGVTWTFAGEHETGRFVNGEYWIVGPVEIVSITNSLNYVSQREVDITHSDAWNPDRRAPTLPYEPEHIGMPEWGIRHTRVPQADNRHWAATYRDINNSVLPGFVLAALLMDQRAAWNHEPLFDYADRVMVRIDDDIAARVANLPPPFVTAMWKAYR